ncbi:MAG: hypothetical protein V4773_13965 [Verrucomicrobiota bacterium]
MKTWFHCLIVSCAGAFAWGAETEPQVRSWPTAEAVEIAAKLFAEMRAKGTQSNGVMLGEWGTHTAAITVRLADGVAELHREIADFFIVLEGEATLVTGGTLINASEKSVGELRATAIKGGEKRVLRAGDMAYIPSGVPHQLLVKGRFAYYVIKAKATVAAKP